MRSSSSSLNSSGRRCAGDPLAVRNIRRRGKFKKESRAAPIVAAAADRPSIRIDDPVADGESETGSLPDRLGGEERLEQLRLVLGRHPGPVVLNFEPHLPSGLVQADDNAAA